jgi:hypothetical protein
VIIELPAEYIKTLIQDMPIKWPQLTREKMSYLATGFNSEK